MDFISAFCKTACVLELGDFCLFDRLLSNTSSGEKPTSGQRKYGFHFCILQNGLCYNCDFVCLIDCQDWCLKDFVVCLFTSGDHTCTYEGI